MSEPQITEWERISPLKEEGNKFQATVTYQGRTITVTTDHTNTNVQSKLLDTFREPKFLETLLKKTAGQNISLLLNQQDLSRHFVETTTPLSSTIRILFARQIAQNKDAPASSTLESAHPSFSRRTSQIKGAAAPSTQKPAIPITPPSQTSFPPISSWYSSSSLQEALMEAPVASTQEEPEKLPHIKKQLTPFERRQYTRPDSNGSDIGLSPPETPATPPKEVKPSEAAPSPQHTKKLTPLSLAPHLPPSPTKPKEVIPSHREKLEPIRPKFKPNAEEFRGKIPTLRKSTMQDSSKPAESAQKRKTETKGSEISLDVLQKTFTKFQAKNPKKEEELPTSLPPIKTEKKPGSSSTTAPKQPEDSEEEWK